MCFWQAVEDAVLTRDEVFITGRSIDLGGLSVVMGTVPIVSHDPVFFMCLWAVP